MLGPIMCDLQGHTLTIDEESLIQHPLVGGIILFSRNYEDPKQLIALTQSIRAIKPELLIAVDQEGGRVQRFRDGFTRLPAGACFGARYSEDEVEGLALAKTAGWLMAAELLAAGVDFSFAPVLDLNLGRCEVIGDRAFASSAEDVSALAGAFAEGAGVAGMGCVGKHFPSHANVIEDSHLTLPTDTRSLQALSELDLLPYGALKSIIRGVMPAHIIYKALDDSLPAGFSKTCLQNLLRETLAFDGAIFSDDLSMKATETFGSLLERASLALNAGCDMILICNQQAAAIEVIESLNWTPSEKSDARLRKLRGNFNLDWNGLHQSGAWHCAVEKLQAETH